MRNWSSTNFVAIVQLFEFANQSKKADRESLVKLGWKLIIAAVVIGVAGNMMEVVPIIVIGVALFWIAVLLLLFRIGSKPKSGAGSGKL